MAYRMAHAGKRVLIIDLDLESPGLSTTLLEEKQMPDYGVVDWLVENAVGQADDALLLDMVASSLLANGAAEDIRIVPSGGKKGDYLAKLSRAYMVFGESNDLEFAERINQMICALEEREKPDVVFI